MIEDGQVHDWANFYATARRLEPSDSDVATVLRRLRERPRKRRSATALALAVALAIAFGAALSTQGHAAFRDAIGSLGVFLAGGQAPGQRALRDEYPSWLDNVTRPTSSANDPAAPRVIASAGSDRLYGYRDRTTNAICLGFGHHAAVCGGDATWWRAQLEAQGMLVYGPTFNGRETDALWGLVTAEITTVSVIYGDGPVTTTSAASGFVIRVDPSREPKILEGRDANGSVIARISLADRTWHPCLVETGCGA